MNNTQRASRRGSSLLSHAYIILGVLIGLGLGLLFSWVISPATYGDTSTPVTLRSDFKDQYRAIIASAYLATGDLARAQARLALLGDSDPSQALTMQAQRAMAQGDPAGSAYALAVLSEAIQGSPLASLISPAPGIPFLASETSIPIEQTEGPTSTPSSTPTPILSPTPRPTRTPTATLGAPYVLISQETLCDASLAGGLLQVEVLDAAGRQVPGVEIRIAWHTGEQSFYTGFKPELGYGYADFIMTPGIIYSLRLASGGTAASNLSAPACQDSNGEDFWGGLRLVFRQP